MSETETIGMDTHSLIDIITKSIPAIRGGHRHPKGSPKTVDPIDMNPDHARAQSPRKRRGGKSGGRTEGKSARVATRAIEGKTVITTRAGGGGRGLDEWYVYLIM
jgi:hypothetical protein